MSQKQLISLMVLLLLAFFAFSGSNKIHNDTDIPLSPSVTEEIKDTETPLVVEVADTTEERIFGLSGRESLAKNTGLLFIFDQPGLHGIWMKDMKFAIDIIWLDRNYTIIDIKENATPRSYPEVFIPRSKADLVLEVNAGFAKEQKLLRGNVLKVSVPQNSTN